MRECECESQDDIYWGQSPYHALLLPTSLGGMERISFSLRSTC